jgi:hypothetical protein
MIRKSTIAAAALAILIAPAAHAQSVAASRAWMSAAAEWSTPYVKLNTDYAAFLGGLIRDETTAETYFRKGDAAGGAVWAKAWAPDQLDQYARLKTRAQALGLTQPPAPPGAAGDRLAAPVIKGLAAMPLLIVGEVTSGEAMVGEAVTLGARTAGGDKAAADQLVGKVLALQIAGLRSEIAQSSINFALPDDPSADADDAVVQVDRAAISVTEAAITGFEHRPVDRPAVAAAVRARADGIEVDANAMEQHSATLLQKYGAPAGQTPNAVVAAFTTGMQTFPQSAAVERKVAIQLRAIAVLIEQPDSTPPQWLQAITDNLSDLLGQAAQLSDQRRAAAGG